MSRISSKLLVVVLIGVFAGLNAQCAPQEADCAEAERQLAELTKRIDSLEKQLQAVSLAKAAAPARPKPQPKPGVPDPIYTQIDLLLADGKIDEAQKVYEDRKATGERSATINTLTREMAVVGKPVPNPWPIEKWYQGESEVNLEKGTTLLVFWESWCPHCKSEVPKLQKTYERFKSRGLQVVGLTRLTKTATEEAVVSFIEDNRVSYPMAKETGGVVSYFNVKGIPAAAVIKDGKIVWRGHPLRLSDEMLQKWL